MTGNRPGADSATHPLRSFVRGGAWILALTGGTQMFNVARLIILGRLLDPKDFGLMGMALLVILVIEAISQTGFQQALTQTPKNGVEFLDTAWSITLIRGALILSALWAASSWIAALFEAEEMLTILPVMGLAMFLQSASNPAVLLFLKRMEFRKQVYYEGSGILTDFLIAIGIAIFHPSVWALVYGFLGGSATRLFMSFLLVNYVPRFGIKVEKAKELFHFSIWITGSSMSILIGGYLDHFIVATFLSATSLGYYRIAHQASNLAAGEITNAIGRVALPTYANMQDERTQRSQAYMRILELISLLTLPIATSVIFLGHDFVGVVLGEKWLPMVPAMQILAAAALLKCLASTGTAFFIGTGRPKYEFFVQSVRGAATAVLVVPLTIYFGIGGTALAVLFSSTGMAAAWIFCLRKIDKSEAAAYLSVLVVPFLSAAGVAVFYQYSTMGGLNGGAFSGNSLLDLLVALAAGSCGYLALILVFHLIRPKGQRLGDIRYLFDLLARRHA